MKVLSKVLDTEKRDGCVRVAFASSTGETVDEHFGWATSFFIYDISPDQIFKVGRIQFADTDGEKVCNPENKHFAKIEALENCHIVYSQSIGGPAAARLTQKKIHPMITKDDSSIYTLLEKLKAVLNGPLPPWMRKITGQTGQLRYSAVNE